MVYPAANLQILKATRKPVVAGDIFAMKLPDGGHLFGRVLEADIKDLHRAPMPGSYLIYVYRYRSETLQPDDLELAPEKLLLPPLFINKMPWNRGYFLTVSHQPLRPEDHLSQYCFWDGVHQRFCDEKHQTLPHESEPCGDWGLVSYRWLDDQISDAVGIPRVAEDA